VYGSESKNKIIDDRAEFEKEKMTRRVALRKFGITTGMSVFSLLAVDDLARIVISKMEEHRETRHIAEAVANEFNHTGVAFAQRPGNRCPDCDADVYCYNCCNQPQDNCTDIYNFNKCECDQAAADAFPDCIDADGNPTGLCPDYSTMLQACMQNAAEAALNCTD
jgi:hypothetical protein